MFSFSFSYGEKRTLAHYTLAEILTFCLHFAYLA